MGASRSLPSKIVALPVELHLCLEIFACKVMWECTGTIVLTVPSKQHESTGLEKGMRSHRL